MGLAEHLSVCANTTTERKSCWRLLRLRPQHTSHPSYRSAKGSIALQSEEKKIHLLSIDGHLASMSIQCVGLQPSTPPFQQPGLSNDPPTRSDACFWILCSFHEYGNLCKLVLPFSFASVENDVFEFDCLIRIFPLCLHSQKRQGW